MILLHKQMIKNRINYLKKVVITCQHDIDGYKKHLLHEFGQYQSGQQYDQVQELISVMIELVKFEAHLLESLQKYFHHEAKGVNNRPQLNADIESVNRRLQLFMYQCTALPEKDQYFNSAPLDQHRDY